jgi:Ca2+-binding EF-hand superfamily protein
MDSPFPPKPVRPAAGQPFGTPAIIHNHKINTPMKTAQTSLLLACGLTLLALPAARANDSGEKFKLMDANGDGRISREEHAAGAKQMFAKLDANNDGVITIAEMDAGVDVKKTSKLKFWDKKDEKSASEKLAVIDSNADGQVTRSEHETSSDQLFTKMDTNNDGFLSKDELEEGHKLLKKDK